MDKRRSLVTKLSNASKALWKTATNASLALWKIATNASFVPLLALLLTVFSVAATHRQNRLSVIPKLSFVWKTDSEDIIGLFLENSGAGPAVIKAFTMDDSEDLLDSAEIFSNLKFRSVGTLFRTYFLQNGASVRLITSKSDNVIDLPRFESLINGDVLVKRR
jgi:hypothetical protein